MDRKDVARILEEIGLLLQIKGENPLRYVPMREVPGQLRCWMRI